MDRENAEGRSCEDLAEALRALRSLLHKCRQAGLKLRPGSPQSTLTSRRVAALEIACQLIEKELGQESPER